MSLAGPFKFDPRAFWGDENVKLMTGGHRNKGSETQDLEEARDAVLRSIEISREPDG